MKIAEVFGTPVGDFSLDAQGVRASKFCRFRGDQCTKVRKLNPLGVCSLSRDSTATVVCPVRFIENGQVFRDAGALAFGSGAKIVVFPEYKLLSIPGEDERTKKIGKVDFLLGKIIDGNLVDFAALELQAVYSSGGGVQQAFDHYTATNNAGVDGDLGVDFRSSAQKRLVPQLRLKVPIFRRWGKRFFVAIDTSFFAALPSFGTTTAGNSEVTWLAYPLATSQNAPMSLGRPDVHFTEWSKVEQALEEGSPPDSPGDVLAELQARLSARRATYFHWIQT